MSVQFATVKNPLDDDQYDGNDEQIEDLKAALKDALSLLERLHSTASVRPGYVYSALARDARKFVGRLGKFRDVHE